MIFKFLFAVFCFCQIVLAEQTSLRAALQVRGWNPPDSQLVVQVNDAGATVTTDQSGFAKATGTTLCSYNGAASTQVTMKMDVNFPVPVGTKFLLFSCPLSLKFPNAKSGDCDCDISYTCSQGFWAWSDWTCGYIQLNCGNNACASLANNPGEWNSNDVTSQTVTIQPADGSIPNPPVKYDGDIEVSWVLAASGVNNYELKTKTSFSSSTDQSTAKTNGVDINGSAQFGGVSLGASTSSSISQTLTTTVSSTQDSQKTCAVTNCSLNLYQARYVAYNKAKTASVVIQTCIFKCGSSIPTCDPESCKV